MTTTIASSAGVSPEWLDLGPGAAKTYSAIDMRRVLYSLPVQEGATDPTAYKVSAGTGMTVSIAASTSTGALVIGDSVTAQGFYYVPPHSAAIVENITASHATLPRIDQIILEVLDSTYDGGASNIARTRVVDGTATSGATLDNRTGVAALPSTAIRLADLLVPAASASVSAGNIRDRRAMSKGAHSEVTYTAGTLLATASTTMAELNSALSKRIELSGADLLWRFRCNLVNSAANLGGDAGPWIAGAVYAVANGGGKSLYNVAAAAATGCVCAFHDVRSITPGSTLVSVGGNSGSGSGTATFSGDTTRPAQIVVSEIVRPEGDST